MEMVPIGTMSMSRPQSGGCPAFAQPLTAPNILRIVSNSSSALIGLPPNAMSWLRAGLWPPATKWKDLAKSSRVDERQFEFFRNPENFSFRLRVGVLAPGKKALEPAGGQGDHQFAFRHSNVFEFMGNTAR